MEPDKKDEGRDGKNHLSCGLFTGHDYKLDPETGIVSCKRCGKEFKGHKRPDKKARLTCVLFLGHSWRSIDTDFHTGMCVLECWRCGDLAVRPIDKVF